MDCEEFSVANPYTLMDKITTRRYYLEKIRLNMK